MPWQRGEPDPPPDLPDKVQTSPTSSLVAKCTYRKDEDLKLYKRKCLFVATVSTDRAVFVATLPVYPFIFVDVVLAN